VIRTILYGALMWGVLIYALRRGGREERLVSTLMVVTSYLTVLLVGPFAKRFQHIEYSILLVDFVVFLFIFAVALRSHKFWPLWLTAMYALTVLSHFAPLVPHMLPWSYYNVTVIWSYLALIVLGFATYRHHHQQQ